MAEPTPTEFVAGNELSRYPAKKVLALIAAARRWCDALDQARDSFDHTDEELALGAAVDALTEGSTDLDG